MRILIKSGTILVMLFSVFLLSSASFGFKVSEASVNGNGETIMVIGDSERAHIHLNHKWSSGPQAVFRRSQTIGSKHISGLICHCPGANGSNVTLEIEIKQATGDPIIIERGSVFCPKIKPKPGTRIA